MMTSSTETHGFVVLSKTAVANFGSVYETSKNLAGVKEGHLSPIERGVDATGGIVYVDLGRPNGVAPGDLFIVYRETPAEKILYKLPHDADDRLRNARVAIAEIVILKVEDRSSTALITYSIDGIMEGDIIEKRPPLPRR